MLPPIDSSFLISPDLLEDSENRKTMPLDCLDRLNDRLLIILPGRNVARGNPALQPVSLKELDDFARDRSSFDERQMKRWEAACDKGSPRLRASLFQRRGREISRRDLDVSCVVRRLARVERWRL